MKTLIQIAGIITLVAIVGACKTTSGRIKPQTEDITGKYWKFIENNEKSEVFDGMMRREPFITLTSEGNRVKGHDGCNTLVGTYEISEGNRIRFSQMASTRAMCRNIEIEGRLKWALEMTDNYTLSADGKYLLLNKARMALARFEAMNF